MTLEEQLKAKELKLECCHKYETLTLQWDIEKLRKEIEAAKS